MKALDDKDLIRYTGYNSYGRPRSSFANETSIDCAIGRLAGLYPVRHDGCRVSD